MDGSFACPECGNEVEVQGLAPGRQVRCGFCDRLLEVPFLPRSLPTGWRRSRTRQRRWIAWAWAGLAVAASITLIAGGVHYVRKRSESAHERSIHRLLESSRKLETSGRIGEALIELDAALHLISESDPKLNLKPEGPKKHRQELALQDARSILDGLIKDESTNYPLGNWLGLIARVERDADLASLKLSVHEHFLGGLKRELDSRLDLARQAGDLGQSGRAVDACERVVTLLEQLPPDLQKHYRAAADRLVADLISQRGVVLDMSRTEFVYGSQSSYLAELEPPIAKAFELKGYLPNRAKSAFSELWRNALYRLDIEIIEHLEGNYLSTQNRITRIEVRLTLTSQNQIVWQTTPAARTTVPLPNMAAYQSSRVAVNSERSEELENLLYTNARGQIGEKLGFALNNLPARGSR